MGQQKKSSPSPSQSDETSKEKSQEGESILFVGAKRALVGGLLAGGVAIAGQLLVGQIYGGTEARRLLESMIPSSRYVGSGVVTASATILALMLTMLSLSRHAASSLESEFYKRVEQIGLLSTIGLIASVLLLLLLSIPLEESQQLPSSWYTFVYYFFLTLTAGVAGTLVTIVLMLYNALKTMITVLSPDYFRNREEDPNGNQ